MKFNRRLVPICTTYFLLSFAIAFTLPYTTLLLRTLGLTLADAGLVTGLGPVFGFFLTPLAGYIGDKIGYRPVLLVTIVGLMLSSTAMNFIPVYREYSAKVGVDKSLYNSSWESFDLKSIVWFGRYNNPSIECDFVSLENIIKEITCEDAVFEANITFAIDEIKVTESENCTDLDKKTCKYFVKLVEDQDILICDAKFQGEVGSFETGSHTLTLWVYFALKTMTKILINVMFNITDGAASTIAIKENFDYAKICFFAAAGSIIPNFITGPIVDNVGFGTDYWDCLAGETVEVSDFKVPFFIQDGVLIIMMIVIFFFLEIEIQKPEKKLSFKEEFSWILNPAPIGFFFTMFVVGMTAGCLDTYLYVFAQESLGVSISFLGYMNTISMLSTMVVPVFSKFIIDRLGIINTLCLSAAVVAVRICAFGLTYSTYPFLGYAALEFFFQLSFVANIAYIAVIAPHFLTATAISLGSVICWIVGMGLGSLLSAFLVEAFSIRVMFIIVGIATTSYYLLYCLLYQLVIKRFQVNQNIEDVEEKPSETFDEKTKEEKKFQENLSARMVMTRM